MGSVPVWVTTDAATCAANSSMLTARSGLSARSQPPDVPSQARTPAMKASPAPMVLTTSTGTAGTETGGPAGV